MNIIDKILTRRSERAYLPKPIEKAKLEQLIAVINSSPTSTNSQDFSAIIVDDVQLRQKVSLGAATQKHVIEAPLFIIFCADKNRIEYAAKQKQTAIHTNTLNNFLTASGDAFIAATLTGAAALELGLGFCYIGLVRRNLLAISQALNLTGSIVPVVGLTLVILINKTKLNQRLTTYIMVNTTLNNYTKKLSLMTNKWLLTMMNGMPIRSQTVNELKCVYYHSLGLKLNNPLTPL